MANIDDVQVSYDEYGYTHTEFPNNIDRLYPKRMPYSDELPYINQYNSYWAQGNMAAASQVLANHPDIVDGMIDLDFLLTIHHSQLALERFFRDQVVQYIRDLQDATEKTMQDTLNSSNTSIEQTVSGFEEYIKNLVTFKGEYDETATYKKYDVVTYSTNGITCAYMVVVDETTGNLPVTNNFVPITFKGEKGNPGINFVPMGEWDSSITYAKNQAVTWNGVLYYLNVDSNIGSEPFDGSDVWKPFLIISQQAKDIFMANGTDAESKLNELDSNLQNIENSYSTKEELNTVKTDVQDIAQNYATKDELNTAVDNIQSNLPFLELLSGNGVPTTTTQGVIRQYYQDTSTGRLYECEGVDTDGNYIWTKLIRETDSMAPTEVWKFATSTGTSGYEDINNIDHRYFVIDVGDNNILKYYSPIASAWKPITSVWS